MQSKITVQVADLHESCLNHVLISKHISFNNVSTPTERLWNQIKYWNQTTQWQRFDAHCCNMGSSYAGPG